MFMKLSPKEDFQEWLTNNFDVIKDSISDECREWSDKHDIQKCKPFDKQKELDIVDVDNLADNIAKALETGLLNVISTYKDIEDD